MLAPTPSRAWEAAACARIIQIHSSCMAPLQLPACMYRDLCIKAQDHVTGCQISMLCMLNHAIDRDCVPSGLDACMCSPASARLHVHGPE